VSRPTAAFVLPHPDDEAIFTGGAIRRAADAGWHVVLVLATSGEEGTMPAWVALDAADHRRMETAEAAQILGVGELHYLGYRDSGMVGHEANASPGSLAASIDEASGDLAELLEKTGATTVVGQDPNGIYGHPDHVAVHHVVRRAGAATVNVTEVLEATLDRAWLLQARAERIAAGRLDPASWCAVSASLLGVTEAHLHLDVTPELAAKQAAMAAHASQVPDATDFMGIPPGVFHHVVRNEWFVRVHDEPGPLERALRQGAGPS
jgi:LmbE family N-acetylglucosaminyl deacetylase